MLATASASIRILASSPSSLSESTKHTAFIIGNPIIIIIVIFTVTIAILLQLLFVHTSSMSPSSNNSDSNIQWFRSLRINKENNNNNNNNNNKENDEPQYFSGQFEYEVSPRSSPTNIPDNNNNNNNNYATIMSDSDTNMDITERMVPVTKTIYLIRHAESDENRRLASLSRSIKGLVTSLKIPTKDDLVASAELLHISAQIDSDVSPKGRRQITQLGTRLFQDQFVSKMGIQLVAHSPLKRARSTCKGMLGCIANDDDANDNDNDHNGDDRGGSKNGKSDDQQSADSNNKNSPPPIPTPPASETITRVVELDLLSERTPMEWLPIHHDAFTKRIANFEKWLSEQPEDVIAIVGHSQYFKSMLGLTKKFKNCDVWSLQFDYHSVEVEHKGVKHDVRAAQRDETQRKMKRKLKGAFQQTKKKQEPNSNSKRGGDNHDDDDDDGDNDAMRDGDRDVTIRKIDTDASVYEDSEEIYEIDGVRVDDVELPRGWRDLKRHYTFDPSLEKDDEDNEDEEEEEGDDENIKSEGGKAGGTMEG